MPNLPPYSTPHAVDRGLVGYLRHTQNKGKYLGHHHTLILHSAGTFLSESNVLHHGVDLSLTKLRLRQEDVWGSRSIPPLIYTSAVDRRQLFLRGKIPRYPLDKSRGEPQSRSGHCGDETASGLKTNMAEPVPWCYITHRYY